MQIITTRIGRNKYTQDLRYFVPGTPNHDIHASGRPTSNRRSLSKREQEARKKKHLMAKASRKRNR